jgi:BolA family transcriptional regulator, general stress-responsive regulator
MDQQHNNRVILFKQKLNQTLNPTLLEITDQSAAHHGHAGAASGGGHYTVTISSKEFEGKPLLECHRLVYSALDEWMGREIHALRINVV